jgi:hypothetical protein
MDCNTEIIVYVIAESGEIRCPRTCYSSSADYVLEKDIAGGNEGHKISKLYP